MTTTFPGLVDEFDFRYPKLARVVFRANALSTTVPEQLREWGCRKAMLVVPRSLAESESVLNLSDHLRSEGMGGAVFCRAMQHAPIEAAADLARELATHGIDALITIGGSSVSDTAKAANLMVSHGLATDEVSIAHVQEALAKDASRAMVCRLTAVPTTLSGGEFTPVVGISERATKHKAVLRHHGVCADMIILDPALARQTPDRLWAGTGMKLIDHAVERLLARNHNPLIDVQCRHGLRAVLDLLGPSVGGGADRDPTRAALLQVLWLIQSGHGNVGTGLSHALSHQIGGMYGLDHGAGSAIFLPATLRLLARTGRVVSARARQLTEAIGITDPDAPLDDAATRIEEVRDRLGLPRSLSDAGILSLETDQAVAAVLADPTVRASPGRPFAPQEIAELLQSVSNH